MTRRMLLALLLVFAAVLYGCGAKKAAPAPPAAAPPADRTPAAPASGPPGAPVQGRFAVLPGDSIAGYAVKEKLISRELPNAAVGTTRSVTGELILDGGRFQPSTITVDLRTLKSDVDRRDERLKTRGLETDKYPLATYSITGTEGLDKLTEGARDVTFKLTGLMKIHDTEKPLTLTAKAKLEGNTLTLAVAVGFKMTEFNVQPPNVAGMVTVNDDVRLDVMVIAKR